MQKADFFWLFLHVWHFLIEFGHFLDGRQNHNWSKKKILDIYISPKMLWLKINELNTRGILKPYAGNKFLQANILHESGWDNAPLSLMTGSAFVLRLFEKVR